jgi:dihydroorotase-like cyclic amidohydrolase
MENSMSVDTIVTNCKIVRHDGILNAGLAIDQGKVVAIAKDAELPSADNMIDGKGNYIIPGVVDAHVI